MGIFDGYQFGDSPQGSLIDRLFQQLGVQNQYQPGNGFAPNPMDANAALPQQQNAPIAVGSNYMMPRMGDGFSQNTQPAPQMPQPIAQQSAALPPGLQPYQSPGGLSGAFRGFAANAQGGPLGMLMGGIGGAMGMGQGTDQEHANRNAASMYRSLVPILGEQKATLAVLNPALGQKMVETALGGKQYTFSAPTADGTVLRLDPHNGTATPVYQGGLKPTFGVINEEDGKKTYGWTDPSKRTVTPYQAPGADDKEKGVAGPDGKLIPYPEGVDKKTFRNEISKINADAAGGKKTEVQAKDEKFANKMENAEKNIKGIEGEGSSYMGRAAEGFPLVGNTAATNWLKSDSYQKYQQARDNFITALLRDESGAAIGTPEFARYERELFPQPGDGAGVIAQKREARRIAIDGMKKGAGPGYKSPTYEGGGSEAKADPLGIR